MYSWESDMPTSIRLAPEIEERLDFLATKTGRSKAYYLRELIERGLEDIEDYYLAAEVLERIRSGDEDIMTTEDFWRGLDA
jgi:RHH-type rel operon transcriptional repressor/antitoxin RelB